ncbi:MAG: hypothetical protein KF716_20565 [Anaerolineae bacterium]|nr:hypothetical protein [Anaerolineae bacterium]
MRSRFFRLRYLMLIAVIVAIAVVLFVLSLASGPTVLQEGNGYADAMGHFTAPIPAGWTNASTSQYGMYTKGDSAMYLVTLEAADVKTGIAAAMALIAPTIDLTKATLMHTGDASAVNGVWQENVYQLGDGRIYYTDTQIKRNTAILTIFTAPSMIALMGSINDAHAVLVGIRFAGEEVVMATPNPTATAAPLPTTAVTLPALTGHYAVGRTIFTWVDSARQEIYAEDKAAKRILTVWAWYPADVVSDAQPAPYLTEAMSEAIKTIWAVNAAKITSHAVANAPISAAQPKYPVLVFSHGNQSNSAFSTALLEEIASHGYIVFGIDHTYNAFLTTLPDGQVIQALQAATPETDETLALRVADVRFVLDQIAALNTSESALAGHLDLAHLGLIGHSFGGATMAEACRQDQRCKAVAVIDVPLRGEVAVVGLSQPIMLMDSEVIPCDQFVREVQALSANPPFGLHDLCEAIKRDRQKAATAALTASSAAYHLSLVGTRHNSFTDLPFLVQQQPALKPNLGGVVTIDAERGWRVSSDYLLAFFGKHLRGETTSLLDGASAAYSEVIFDH